MNRKLSKKIEGKVIKIRRRGKKEKGERKEVRERKE